MTLPPKSKEREKKEKKKLKLRLFGGRKTVYQYTFFLDFCVFQFPMY